MVYKSAALNQELHYVFSHNWANMFRVPIFFCIFALANLGLLARRKECFVLKVNLYSLRLVGQVSNRK